MAIKIFKKILSIISLYYMAETIGERLGTPMTKFKNGLSKKFKNIIVAMVLVGMLIVCMLLALHFLLLGIAHWLNELLNSSYLGFFISSLLALVWSLFIVWRIHHKLK